MTNEEAIFYLDDIATDAVYRITGDEKKAIGLAISALREKQEREKGCEYCNSAESMAYGQDSLSRRAYIYLDGNLLTADLYSDSMAAAICFCPMCGRPLTPPKGEAE